MIVSGLDGPRIVREAIRLTGRQRLRPVLLTTVTTILGLLPMAFNVGIDFIHLVALVMAEHQQRKLVKKQ